MVRLQRPTSSHSRYCRCSKRMKIAVRHQGAHSSNHHRYHRPSTLNKNLSRSPSSCQDGCPELAAHLWNFLCSSCHWIAQSRRQTPRYPKRRPHFQWSLILPASALHIHRSPDLVNPYSACLNLLHSLSIHHDVRRFVGEIFPCTALPDLAPPLSVVAIEPSLEGVLLFLWWRALDPDHPHSTKKIASSLTCTCPFWDPMQNAVDHSLKGTPWQLGIWEHVSIRRQELPASVWDAPLCSGSCHYRVSEFYPQRYFW